MKEKRNVEELVDRLIERSESETQQKERKKRRRIKIKKGEEKTVFLIFLHIGIFLIVFSSVAMVCMLPPTADIPPPKILGEISNKELYNFIVNRTVWYGLNTNLFIGDYKYKLTSVSEIRRFLRKDYTDRFFYDDDEFDCDDFATRLYGQITIPGWSEICFGEICYLDKESGEYHCGNIFVTKEGKDLVIYTIEPQNDSIKKTNRLKNVIFIFFS
ncbi:hypothetical protein J7K24_02925 [bacterium]|nr:hypothetical protein [bacterium]